MNGETMLLNHARRYFRAAAECSDLRKMRVLVDLGLDYLELAARLNAFKTSSKRTGSRDPGESPKPDEGAD
jgi:hypothetical protein